MGAGGDGPVEHEAAVTGIGHGLGNGLTIHFQKSIRQAGCKRIRRGGKVAGPTQRVPGGAVQHRVGGLNGDHALRRGGLRRAGEEAKSYQDEDNQGMAGNN